MAFYLAGPGVWSLVLLLWGSFLVPSPTVVVARNAKRGIASAPSDYQALDLMKLESTSQASWVYNWNDYPPQSVPRGLEYVPMQWGEENIGNLKSRIQHTGAKVLLAFNEPDIPSQSNLSPETAAQLWKRYIQPLKWQYGIRLGSPAVANVQSRWLKDFISACTGCTIDFLVIHWYGQGADNFIHMLKGAHQEFPNYKIWVTEWADTTMNDPAVVQTFLEQTTHYMDSQPWLERYSWFAYTRQTDGLGMQSSMPSSFIPINAICSIEMAISMHWAGFTSIEPSTEF
ncbi:hypothetical protein D9758_005372 [Tetrapyrgos nigripes]|uniref:Asl1-like glycosyl hydrolase catalytic domain-containing protein n=1 Tax=Tetrapyrgos nigripes TaxID=182062 RepID=A0A8H5GIC0_9AGAR|nr:hypothetical protein D9758_005372 [Tetrapyrgos nigripes]